MKISEKFKIEEEGKIFRRCSHSYIEERFFLMTKILDFAAICNRKGFSERTHSYILNIRLLSIILFSGLVTALLSSCGINKYIPEDELLLAETKVVVDAEFGSSERKRIEAELSPLIRPQTNSTFLGGRPGVRWHYRANSEKSNFINRFLSRRFGEEAVLLSDLNPDRNMDILLNRLENKGYFIAEADYSVDTLSRKKARVNFYLFPEKAYTIKSYVFEGEQDKLGQLISKSLDNSLIQVGDPYELSVLRRERERISNFLQEEGYFYFISDHLRFSMDTAAGDKQIDLYLQIKSEVPLDAKIPYRIRSITIFPDHNNPTADGMQTDTVEMERYTIIRRTDDFLPRRFDNFIQLEKGDLYSRTLSNRTRQRLFSMGAFGFVNLRHSSSFNETDSIPTEGFLDTRIQLSPLTRLSLRSELQLISKSNNFMGPLFSSEIINRNLFKGGEKLNLGIRFGYETQVAGGRQTGLSALESGLTAELVFPRIIAPFEWRDNVAYGVPRTRIALSYSMLSRVKNYRLMSTQLDFGYNWNGSRFASHEIKPIALTFTRLSNTSESFDNILKNNPFLERSFEQQFIPGMQYNFIFNNLTGRDRRLNRLLIFRADFAGNLAWLVDETFKNDDQNTILGRSYAHYLRLDFDLRHYFRLGEEEKIIARLFAGWGMPLSNSLSLPYIKQYFAGGPNSVRAFRIRSLGPGTYRPEQLDPGSFFDQAGDIRLEFNLEYRFPLVSYLKGAVFLDGGNIWLYNENESLPGGSFSSDWYREIALGAGFGIRLDVEILVIRLDLATPLRKPWLADGEKWVSDFSFGERQWRRDNLIWNIAIGYPF